MLLPVLAFSSKLYEKHLLLVPVHLRVFDAKLEYG
jgi:hypothetical protein